MDQGQFNTQQDPIPNPEDGGKTTWWRFAIVHNCGKEAVYAIHPEKKVAKRNARRAFRVNGGKCPACHAAQAEMA
jgi:hypothetical protein